MFFYEGLAWKYCNILDSGSLSFNMFTSPSYKVPGSDEYLTIDVSYIPMIYKLH